MGDITIFFVLLFIVSVVFTLPQPEGNPISDPRAQVLVANGSIRFTILTTSLVRIESVTPENNKLPPFQDSQTLVAVNRFFDVPPFSVSTSENTTIITTSSFNLTYTYAGDGVLTADNLKVELLSPRLWMNITKWVPGDEPDGNLFGTFHTLDTLEGWHSLNCTYAASHLWGETQQQSNNNLKDIEFNQEPLAHCAWGLISKGGWSLIDDSSSPIFNNGWISPHPGSCSLLNSSNQNDRISCFPDNPFIYQQQCETAGCCYNYIPSPPLPLNLFYSSSRFDYFSQVTCAGCANLYSYISFEGYLFGDPGPEDQLGEKVLLNNYWKERNPGGDNALSSSFPTNDYSLVSSVGYAWAPNISQPSNTYPLKLWYNSIVQDYFTTATPAQEQIAQSGNYSFVELLGYIQKGNPSNQPVLPSPPSPPSCYQPSGNNDWYLFTHGIDYKQALFDFSLLSGNIPLPRRHWLGMSWSRWGNSLNQETTYQQIQNLSLTGFPLSTYVFDMNWHLKPEWTGWTWDTVQYPNHTELLDWIHSLGIPIGANLHDYEGVMPFELRYPDMAKANGIDPSTNATVQFRISDKTFADSLSDIILEPLAEEGIDFWWTDWQQGETVGVEDCYGLNPTFMLNHYRFINYTGSSRRGLIHSRWGGLGNHRYTTGFGGDVLQSWDSLQFMIYFTTTASNVLFGWWGHEMMQVQDVVPPTDAVLELFTRVMQFGAFSPIYTNWGNDGCPDNLWELPEQYLVGTRVGLMQRAQLLLYRYTFARIAHDSGISLIRPMYYDYPLDEDSYNSPLQYMLGTQIIVAPVNSPMNPSTNVSSVSVWFPSDENVDFWATFDEPRVQFESTGEWQNLYYPLNRVPVFVKAGSIIPLIPYPIAQQLGSASQNPSSLEFAIYPSSSSNLRTDIIVYEDDGMSNDYLSPNKIFSNTEAVFTKGALSKCDLFDLGVTGNYSGMPSTRSYIIRFLATGTSPITVVTNNVITPQGPCENEFGTPLPGSWCNYYATNSSPPSPSSLSIAISVPEQPIFNPLSLKICWGNSKHIDVV